MRGFCPLASGSRGNALYLGTSNKKILIDAGISLKALTERLSCLNVDISEIDAVLITHEHIDHIKGLGPLSKKWNIPIFANKDTAKAIADASPHKFQFKIFSTGEPFEFGDIEIHPFSVQHDAIDPVAFTFDLEGHKVGVCADLGFASSLVERRLQGCHYLYIESNHQPSMVHSSLRPAVYKQRVLSRQGHLSNEESAELVNAVYHQEMKHIYLAHLSSECNHPDLALKIMQDCLEPKGKRVPVSIAMQDEISVPVYF